MAFHVVTLCQMIHSLIWNIMPVRLQGLLCMFQFIFDEWAYHKNHCIAGLVDLKIHYIFQRLARECEDVLRMSGSRVTRASLSAAKFTSACIRESLRLHPVAVATGRELNKVTHYFYKTKCFRLWLSDFVREVLITESDGEIPWWRV